MICNSHRRKLSNRPQYRSLRCREMKRWSRWYGVASVIVLLQICQCHLPIEVNGGRPGNGFVEWEEGVDQRETSIPSSRVYQKFVSRSIGRYAVAAFMLSAECVRVYAPAPVNLAASFASVRVRRLMGVFQRAPSRKQRGGTKLGLSYDRFMSDGDANVGRHSAERTSLDPPDKYGRLSVAFKERHGIGLEQAERLDAGVTLDKTAPSSSSYDGVADIPHASNDVAVKRSGFRMSVGYKSGSKQARKSHMTHGDDTELLSDFDDEELPAREDYRVASKWAAHQRLSKVVAGTTGLANSLQRTKVQRMMGVAEKAKGKEIPQRHSSDRHISPRVSPRHGSQNLVNKDDGDASALLNKLRGASAKQKARTGKGGMHKAEIAQRQHAHPGLGSKQIDAPSQKVTQGTEESSHNQI